MMTFLIKYFIKYIQDSFAITSCKDALSNYA